MATFFRHWVDDLGGRLDFVIDLHNVESGESGQLACGTYPAASPLGEMAL